MLFEKKMENIANMENIPKRPFPKVHRKNDAFMLDFENSLLQLWDGFHPKGPRRFEHPEWQKLVLSQVYPNHSDIDFHEYVAWCLSGGGELWFLDNADDECD